MLTFDKAIELTNKLWEFLKNNPSYTKCNALLVLDLDHLNLANFCPCCQYAKERAIQQKDYIKNEFFVVKCSKYCPKVWPEEVCQTDTIFPRANSQKAYDRWCHYSSGISSPNLAEKERAAAEILSYPAREKQPFDI